MTTLPENPFEGMACRDCGAEALRLEWREEMIAKPIGTWSLAGAQEKYSAIKRSWPWCVCGGCGAECRGKQ